MGLSSSSRCLRCVQRYRVRREETCICWHAQKNPQCILQRPIFLLLTSNYLYHPAFTKVHLCCQCFSTWLSFWAWSGEYWIPAKIITIWYYDGLPPTCSLLDSPQERQDQECTFWRTSATGKISNYSSQPKVNKRLDTWMQLPHKVLILPTPFGGGWSSAGGGTSGVPEQKLRMSCHPARIWAG